MIELFTLHPLFVTSDVICSVCSVLWFCCLVEYCFCIHVFKSKCCELNHWLLFVSRLQSLHLLDLQAQWSPLPSSLTLSRLLVLWLGGTVPLPAQLHSTVHTHTHYMHTLKSQCDRWGCFIYFGSVAVFVSLTRTLSYLHSLCPRHSNKGCWTCKFTTTTT